MPLVSAGVYYDTQVPVVASLLPIISMPIPPVVLEDLESAPNAAGLAVPLTLTLTQSGRVDANGITYGGTSTNKQGVGDQVQDKRGVKGVVQKIWPDPQTGRMMVLVGVVPGGTAFPANILQGGPALNQGTVGPEQVTSYQEYIAYANELIILAHADGTGLISGGTSTGLPVATEVVWDKHYLP